MTSGGILKEGCDDATKSTCDEDQVGSVIPMGSGSYFLTHTLVAHFQGMLGTMTRRHSLNDSRQGIFTKHLQYYIDQAGSAARDKYAGFLSAQSSGVYHYGTGSTNVSPETTTP
jgi:hypothetical protein